MTAHQTPPAAVPRTRTLTLALDADALATRAAGDEAVPVSISSEHGVVRTDFATGQPYREILDHAVDSLDLSRARDGLPLLLGHDTREQVGVVEGLRVAPDRRLRGTLRFSRSTRGQEIRQDVLDGIRRALSVGYDPGAEYTEQRARDGMLERRYTRWTPLEVSVVPIPADPTIGVGRSHPSAGVRMSETHTPPAAPPALTDEARQPRESTIYAMAASAGLSAREAAQLVASGRSAEEVGRELLARMQAQAEREGRSVPVSFADQPLGRSRFVDHFAEALFAPEGEAARRQSRELARELGLASRGTLVPLQTRTLTTTGVGTGKEFVPILQGDLIDLMRPRMVATEFGARVETYQGGTIARPKITGDATYTWLEENPGTGVAASDVSTAAVTMTPHAVATRTTYTQQALRASTPEIAFMVMEAHAARLAVAVDAAAIAGTGASNQPTGALFATGTNLVAMGTNGAAVSYGKIVEMEEAIDAANAGLAGLGFVTTPGVRADMRETQDFPSAAAGRPLWGDDNRVLGYRALTTTSMPSTLTKGTADGVCHGAILGDWSQLVIGMWGALDVIVDPYTDAAKGLVHVTSTLYVDIGVLQPNAFAVVRDLIRA